MKKYLVISGLVFISYFLGMEIYNEATKDKTPGKSKRLECQKNVTTFEKAYNLNDIKTAQEKIKNGNYSFSSTIEKAKYAQSKLFNYISQKQTDKIFENELKTYIVKENNQDAKIQLKYNIYENDIKDPGKKTEKSKLYAGYVWLEIKNERNLVIYKVQIDFMDKEGKDIDKSIKCCIKSFMTI